MAANAELTLEEARGRLRMLAKAEKRYAVFVYFCRYYKPETDQGPLQTVIATATGLRQSTISGYIKAAHEALEIPYPLKDGQGLSGAEERRRIELLKQYQAVIIADKTLETLTLPLKNANSSNSEQVPTSAEPIVTAIPPSDTIPPTSESISAEPPLSTPVNTGHPSSSVPPQNPVNPAPGPAQTEGNMQQIFDEVGRGTTPPQRPRPRTVRLIVAGIIGVIALGAGFALGSLINQGRDEIILQTVIAPQTVEVPVTREVEIEVTRRVIETFVVRQTVEVISPPEVTIQVVTATPEPATSTPEISPTPRPSETPKPVFALPFEDTFDRDRRAEWRVVEGEEIIADGKLQTPGQLLMLLGDDTLSNYLVEFEYGGDVEFRIGPAFRTHESYWISGHDCHFQALEGGSWVDKYLIPCPPDNGRLGIKVEGDYFTLYFNGEETKAFKYVTNSAKGPIGIVLQSGQWLDTVRITAN